MPPRRLISASKRRCAVSIPRQNAAAPLKVRVETPPRQ
jgi:hypothetical protein